MRQGAPFGNLHQAVANRANGQDEPGQHIPGKQPIHAQGLKPHHSAEAAQTARHMVGQSDDDLARQIGWTLVGRAERAANHAAEAEAAFRAACDLPVTSTSAPEATIRLAQLLLDRGDNENAARYFTRAVTLCATPELQPVRIHAYVGLGRAALAQGQKELALRYWMTTAFMYHEPEVLPPIIRESIALAESLGKTEEAESLRKTLAEYN